MDPLKKNPRKKKIRELANKERFLIALLAIVILTWGSFKYIIDPQTNKISDLEAEKDSYIAEIDENNRMLKNRDEILENRNLLEAEKVDIEKKFFKSLNQPSIIYTLNELFLKNSIEMDAIRFTEPFYEELDDEEIEKMDISIPFNGTFEDLAGIIKGVEKEPKKIILSSLDVVSSDESEISGIINLGIFSLMGLVDGVEDDSIIITDDNKVNPFIPYGGYIDPNLIIEKDDDYDDDEYEEDEDMSDEDSEDDTSNESSADENQSSEDEALEGRDYRLYKVVKGDHITSISRRVYGDDRYVNEILKINGMLRSNVLPVGKVLKLIER